LSKIQFEPPEGSVTSTFEKILAVDAFPENGLHVATVNGWKILISRTDGIYHAMNDRCTHAASPLSGGRVRGDIIMCPRHGARFELKTGKCVGGGNRDIRTFAIEIRDGIIWIEVPDRPPAIDELPVELA
jgi:anthranilate 1,2-dioxygenase ferredoxin component